jgi:hypothetical protein
LSTSIRRRPSFDQPFLPIDVFQVVERDRRNGGHGLQVAAPLALAPAKGDRARPIDLRRGGRKHRFQADEHGFGPGQKLFEFVHDGEVSGQIRGQKAAQRT